MFVIKNFLSSFVLLLERIWFINWFIMDMGFEYYVRNFVNNYNLNLFLDNLVD